MNINTAPPSTRIHLRQQVAPSLAYTTNNAQDEEEQFKIDAFETFFADLTAENKSREGGSKVRTTWIRKTLVSLHQSTFDEDDLDDELNDSIHLTRNRLEKMKNSFDYDEDEEEEDYVDELKDSIHLTMERLSISEEQSQQLVSKVLLSLTAGENEIINEEEDVDELNDSIHLTKTRLGKQHETEATLEKLADYSRERLVRHDSSKQTRHRQPLARAA